MDQYLTAVQLTSADMAPAMPHSSCLWKQKAIVYSLQLVWLMWQYDSYCHISQMLLLGWLGGITGSASDQRSEGCGFEAY